MLARKVISASISGSLFVSLVGLIMPLIFTNVGSTEHSHLSSFFGLIYAYILISFPIILVYGVLTSIISDKVAEFVVKTSGNKRMDIIISGILHIVFGLILLPFSLFVSILFFIVDRLLLRWKKPTQECKY